MSEYKFPKNFRWGTAASAPQTEGNSLKGGKSPSTWDMWFKLEPERFSGIGPENTSMTITHYREDIANMKAMHLNSYRTSIAWTRLLPDGKTLNPEAVAFYRDYFQTLLDYDIEPIINLFHFDMPWWQMEQGGWLNKEITEHFAFYARTCIEQFGDLVKKWVTFNEPIVHVECSYLYGYHYPVRANFKEAILAGYHTILAHAKAIQAMMAVRDDIEVGTILNLTPVYRKSDRVEDVEAARIADVLNVRSFMDGMVKGVFSPELVTLLREHQLLPEVMSADLELIHNHTAAFLGVNYYQPRRVQAPTQPVSVPATMPEDLYIPYIWEERVINPYRGWEIYPKALLDIARLIRDEYDNMPWFVSENGMGVADEARFKDEQGMIVDTYRMTFIQEHCDVLLEALAEGANCFGYHHWTFVDCWSWLNGYTNRYGFFSMDLETYERRPKASSLWMKNFIDAQGG